MHHVAMMECSDPLRMDFFAQFSALTVASVDEEYLSSDSEGGYYWDDFLCMALPREILSWDLGLLNRAFIAWRVSTELQSCFVESCLLQFTT